MSYIEDLENDGFRRERTVIPVESVEVPLLIIETWRHSTKPFEIGCHSFSHGTLWSLFRNRVAIQESKNLQEILDVFHGN